MACDSCACAQRLEAELTGPAEWLFASLVTVCKLSLTLGRGEKFSVQVAGPESESPQWRTLFVEDSAVAGEVTLESPAHLLTASASAYCEEENQRLALSTIFCSVPLRLLRIVYVYGCAPPGCTNVVVSAVAEPSCSMKP